MPRRRSFSFPVIDPLLADPWQLMVDRSKYGIVNILFTIVRCFDMENTVGEFHASGFIVDIEHGIILSNRHVVGSGPITAKAVFHNYEECNIWPIYRDPIHDFGFFRFNPSELKFKICQIPIYPHATVGTEVRIIGNDGGEKFSIISATISRLDREAPEYGDDYHDYNIFYMQASVATSSLVAGSSGSPVLNIRGQAIGMNSGTSQYSSHSYILPLSRVLRTLECIVNGLKSRKTPKEVVSRGDLLVKWDFYSFAHARRLGLLSELETKFKQFVKNAQGVLVVSDNFVKPNPSFVHILHKGDILIAINKKYISTYDQLAEIIDSNINNILNFCIQRGSEIFMLEVRVLDLHELDLCEYLECGDMVCHAVGLQISRGFSGQNVVCGDVFVASPGVLFESAGIPNRSIIKRINNTQIDNIEHFSMIMTSLADGESATVEYITFRNPNEVKTGVFTIYHSFFRFQRAIRNDSNGLYEYSYIDYKNKKTAEQNTKPLTISVEESKRITMKFTTIVPNDENSVDDLFTKVFSRLVRITTIEPFRVDGSWKSVYRGTGFIVPSSRLVVTDRAAVPSSLGKVKIEFMRGEQRCAKIVFMEDWAPFVVLTWLGSDIKGIKELNLDWGDFDTPMELNDVIRKRRTSELSTSSRYGLIERVRKLYRNDTKVLNVGDNVLLMVLTSFSNNPLLRESRISSVGNLTTPETLGRFRHVNTISVEFENKVTGIGGLLISSRTSEPKILGFLSRHEYSEQDIIHFGIPLASIRPIINILSSKFNAFSIPSSLGSCNNPYYLKFSGIELSFVSIAEANSLGLSSEWCDRLTIAKKDQVICIGKVTASCTYRSGDFLLSIEGKLVSSLMDIQWIENQQFTEWNSIVFRNGFEITQSHSLQKYPINGDFSGFVPKIQCLVCFSGAIIKWSGCQVFKHENFSKFPYISGVLKGSPANIAGISAGFFILRVNGQSISNLNDTCSDSITDTMEAFIYYLKSSVSKNRSVQFELQHWITGAKWIISFVPDEHYWNSWYLTTSRGGELILETL